MARDERRFKMADQDNDMKANKEEFTAFLHPEEYDHMKDIVVLVRDTLTKVLHTETNWISSLSFLTMYFFFFFFFFLRKLWKTLTRMEMA